MSDDDKPPYDYSDPNDRPGGGVAAPVMQQPAAPIVINSGQTPMAASPAPAPAPVQTQSDPNSPYNYADPHDRPGGGTPAKTNTTNTTDSSSDSRLWTALNKPTHNIADLAEAARLTGRGVYDTARVWGNQAVVPHGLDRLMAQMPGAGDYATQAAETERAKKDLGSFAAPVEWWGQNYSAPGIVNRVTGGGGITGAIANNPITTGVVTGGGGTLAGGDFDPMHFIKNAATSALESKAGQAVGSVGSIAAGYLGNTGKALYQKAQDASSALNAADFPGWTAAIQKGLDVRKLQDLQTLYNKGGDVVGKSMDLANEATGAAKEAYQNIANAASKTAEIPKLASDAVTGGLSWLTGGPVVATIGLGANRAANQMNKIAHVRSAIDQAFPHVTGYVKSAVDPQNWRNAVGNAAVVAGNDYEDLRNRVANFSPTGLIP